MATLIAKTDLMAERLREVLSYDPETGIFRWNIRPNTRIRVGAIAGRIHRDGHRIICIAGRQFYAHRLAFFYVHGRWPTLIDHKDRNPDNNRIDNLREATPAQNAANSRRRNLSGFRGAYFYAGKFNASIAVNGRAKHLGRFNTAEEAHFAYLKAARELHGEFVRAA